jgi:hypothetical protein
MNFTYLLKFCILLKRICLLFSNEVCDIEIFTDGRLHYCLNELIIYLNKQTLTAMNQVTREIINGNDQFFPIMPTDYNKFLVISLGTGSNKMEEKFSAKKASKWGIFGWLSQKGTSPIVEIFNRGSADMVDIHLSVLFQALRSEESYLRIQVNYHELFLVYYKSLLIF